jgi:metallophosphoesterase (TIGR03767 family)
LALALLLAATAAWATHTSPDTLGHSTVTQRVLPTGAGAFKTLAMGAGEGYLLREDEGAPAKPNRETRRGSLSYFGQLSDFQLADEESPARVEFMDSIDNPSPFTAAWRPWEALNPQIDDATIRQMNTFRAASPIAQGNGARRPMDFAIDTGDSADSQQLNETRWVRTLLEGGSLNPNSGIDPTGYIHQTCVPAGIPGAAEAAAYTGVQDYNDYIEGAAPQFYDPNTPTGARFGAWPMYSGLMNRAQQTFTAAGVNVPTYVTFGNHDALVQGNQSANRSFEDVATGCIKPMVSSAGDPRDLGETIAAITPTAVLNLLSTNAANVMLVPPDPDRQFVSKAQYKAVFAAGTQADDHGFAYIDPAQETASGGSAGYYSWTPVPGVRFISVDTVSEGGIAGPSADGNIDDPQFQWLRSQFEGATARDELVVLFSHHAIPSLTSDVPDEAAPPCVGPTDAHGHDNNPGCDLDPRTSSPIHLGADMTALLHQYPHVVAWVAGHSHVNDIQAFPGAAGAGFWSIRTAAEADWPQQSRLLEMMDNRDGTLSIFGTILDHASDATAPPSGTTITPATTEEDLASIGRTLSYNDPQTGAEQCSPGCGEGTADDRNVELLINDPRRTAVGGGGGEPGLGCHGVSPGTSGNDTITGTARDDRIAGLRGSDRIRGLAGNDCIDGNRGKDKLFGGIDNDLIRGGGGRDVIKLDAGQDRAIGGRGRDKIDARDGERDEVRCGKGRDFAKADKVDVVKGCETVRRSG